MTIIERVQLLQENNPGSRLPGPPELPKRNTIFPSPGGGAGLMLATSNSGRGAADWPAADWPETAREARTITMVLVTARIILAGLLLNYKSMTISGLQRLSSRKERSPR